MRAVRSGAQTRDDASSSVRVPPARRTDETDEGAVTRTALPSAARCAAAVPVAALGVVLAAGPALADHNPLAPQEGADEHAPISIGVALLLYGLLPLVILLVVAAISWLPGGRSTARYRPTRGWSAAPVWFAGPADPVAAVETAHAGSRDRGGASGDW